MSDTKLNCFICGKELELGMKVYGGSNLWRCEECANKQMQEYDNKDQKIADLETKLAKSNENVKLLAETRVAMCDTIKDLETKLAESEERCDELKQAISKCTDKLPPNVAFDIANDDIRYQIICNLTDRNQEHRNTIKELKQQLAEKEKEIERLNLEFQTQEDWQEKWQKLYDETCNLDQDKIEFAVEQLRLLKSQIIEKRRLYKGKFSEFSNGIRDALYDVEEDIDNQINELKEGK